MTASSSLVRATGALALAALLGVLGGCPRSTSLGDNDGGDAGRDVCVALCPAGSTVGADCTCVTPPTDGGADVCNATCAIGYTVSAACACVAPVCVYRDPEPCTSDTVCEVNGGTCDTARGYCVCPDHADAGACPATEPANGAACASEGLACSYGLHTTGCDSDSAVCTGGHWQVMDTPACPPDGGAGVMCGTLACNAGQLCVRDQFQGGPLVMADDAGSCTSGRVATPCGTGTCCTPAPSYACAAAPAACPSGAPTCDCAASLCTGGYRCTGTAGLQVDCEEDVP